MHFSNFEILSIFAPLFFASILILLWYKKDQQTALESNREKLLTLISVFFWSAFGGITLKILIDLVFNLDSQQVVFSTTWFYVLTILGEEFIKAGSLIIGLELAEQRFNEVSDGLIYGAISALGFLFLENIFYLLVTQNQVEFWTVFSVRSLSIYTVHLFTTTLFGLTYATGYLAYKKHLPFYQVKFKLQHQKFVSPKPYAFIKHFKLILGIGNLFWNIIKLIFCWDLIKRIFLIISKQKKSLYTPKRFLVFPSVFIVEGFLLAFYFHLGYNFLLQNDFFKSIFSSILPLGGFLIYLGFQKINNK